MQKDYNKLFGLYLEKIQLPVVVIDSENTFVHLNQCMKETFGDLTGYNRELLFTEANENSHILKLFDEESSGRVDVDLADVTYKALFHQITDDDEEKYIVVILEDISERKHLQTRITEQLTQIKRETMIAKNIQHSVLPLDDVYWNCIGLTGIYLPATDIGGDVYDILKLNDEETLIYIADVSGHGIQASLLTMYVRENVRANAPTAVEGLDLFTKKILESFISLEIEGMIYVTFLCLKYNRTTSDLSFVNAGHNCPPLILRSNGRSEEIPLRGMPLSIISDPDSYQEEIISIYPGDRIILYTDGIVEEYSKTEGGSFGPEGLRKVAEANHGMSASKLAQTIIDEAAKYMSLSAKDDRTLVIADILN